MLWTTEYGLKTNIATSIVVNEEGNIVQTYRKLHLYDVDLTNKVSWFVLQKLLDELASSS